MDDITGLARHLRACFPSHRVHVRRRRLGLDYGTCAYRPPLFLITLDASLSRDAAILVLVHEWAHVLSWDRYTQEPHCDRFGIAYARAWRAYEQWARG